jgi:hypothetical protein
MGNAQNKEKYDIHDNLFNFLKMYFLKINSRFITSPTEYKYLCKNINLITMCLDFIFDVKDANLEDFVNNVSRYHSTDNNEYEINKIDLDENDVNNTVFNTKDIVYLFYNRELNNLDDFEIIKYSNNNLLMIHSFLQLKIKDVANKIKEYLSSINNKMNEIFNFLNKDNKEQKGFDVKINDLDNQATFKNIKEIFQLSLKQSVDLFNKMQSMKFSGAFNEYDFKGTSGELFLNANVEVYESALFKIQEKSFFDVFLESIKSLCLENVENMSNNKDFIKWKKIFSN